MANEQTATYKRPVELLQNLIRFDTSNPPGNEEPCIRYINGLLSEIGIKTSVLALDQKRPNLIARLTGTGKSPPLLLYGHVDVVTTENQTWQHPPFSGEITDGFIWGRGALDMKSGVAMILSAFMRAKVEGAMLPGDVVLAIVSDEEKGSQYGAQYLIRDHADQFTGVRYGIGEFGGFSFYVGKKTFYPIMVAEKAPLGVLMTIRGPTGYPTLSYQGGAMAKLGSVLEKLDQAHFPVHITPATRLMVKTMSKALPFPSNLVVRQLLNPMMTDTMLKLLGKQVEQFHPLLHNTVNATALMWADNSFRVPDRIGLQLACIMLPGFTPEEMLKELRKIVGDNIDLEINTMFYHDSNSTAVYDPLPIKPDMGLYETLAGVIRESDPSGIPTPLVLPTATDGRIFSKLGIQTYGFLPMKLPQNFTFWETTHEADERIPVEAVTFGADAIYKLLQRF